MPPRMNASRSERAFRRSPSGSSPRGTAARARVHPSSPSLCAPGFPRARRCGHRRDHSRRAHATEASTDGQPVRPSHHPRSEPGPSLSTAAANGSGSVSDTRSTTSHGRTTSGSAQAGPRSPRGARSQRPSRSGRWKRRPAPVVERSSRILAQGREHRALHRSQAEVLREPDRPVDPGVDLDQAQRAVRLAVQLRVREALEAGGIADALGRLDGPGADPVVRVDPHDRGRLASPRWGLQEDAIDDPERGASTVAHDRDTDPVGPIHSHLDDRLEVLAPAARRSPPVPARRPPPRTRPSSRPRDPAGPLPSGAVWTIRATPRPREADRRGHVGG